MSFVPPPYPYDRLEPARAKAEALEGGMVDVSIGTPMDPPPLGVLDVLGEGEKGREVRSYPPSAGTPVLRRAAAEWMARRFAVDVPTEAVAACVGTKELVASVPQWLKLRTPGRDVVLYPSVAYPTYEMGALLAGLRPVPVALDAEWRIDLASIDPADAERALLLWVNSPGNPAGALDDLGEAAVWGARFGVPVFSDECYSELTW
ncbi:MAG: aminotransferase class I/II-fold pyridoxal phosphate-dependent enzyme, partial [Acidimicrobiales bacterium]